MQGPSDTDITRIVRFAFLAPDVVEAILTGTLRAGIGSRALSAPGVYPPTGKNSDAGSCH
ncbi:MAG: hypothetical protein BGO57_12675 [Sphingomonadales bacterium 63-6]|nr:MAG: hypothetical protein BGO57_12675 [Sphingomonadales bacterium 63-6]